MSVLVAPSLLAADFSKLRQEIERVESAGADWLHLDVMDGHFVPNISFGSGVIESLRPHSKLFFDVHLMISDPLRYIEDFANAGADSITFHIESDSATYETIRAIKNLKNSAGNKLKAGLSVKPGTEIEKIYPYLNELDMLLIMTVEPGFGGQSFMSEMLPKIKTLRNEREKSGKTLHIQVDGGISEKTAGLVVSAGADCLVAGSAVFGSPKPEAVIKALRGA